MIYLERFILPIAKEEKLLSKRATENGGPYGYVDNPYPCGLFGEKELFEIGFKNVTIFYGGNGSGKSTLLNILSGNLPQSGGRICFEGEDIRNLGSGFLGILGYMPQQQAYYDRFTAEEFLGYMGALRGMEKRAVAEGITRVLGQVELEEVRKHRIGSFSGGMKQRLLLAQAILGDPKILILDEPTAGLDPKQRISIRNLIASISTRKIVILSTHIVSDIAGIAKDILLLKEGRLLDRNSPLGLKEALRGKVYELHCAPHELTSLQHRYPLSRMMAEGEGFCLRVLSEEPPEGGRAVQPDLEDVYLSRFGE